jgi:hypothetical protein
MAGLVRGLINERGQVGLPDQDFDPDDAYSFHLAIAHFHRIQARILPALGSLLPGVDDEWRAQQAAFVSRAAQLWQALAGKYAEVLQAHGDDQESSENSGSAG